MGYLQGYGAEADYLRNLFNGWWATQIAWPNVRFTPPVNAAWVRFRILPGPARIASVGARANLRRHEGTIVVEVFVPKNDGEGAAEGYCDQVADLFRIHTRQQGLRFSEPYMAGVSETGPWYKRDVLVPFTRDTVFSLPTDYRPGDGLTASRTGTAAYLASA